MKLSDETINRLKTAKTMQLATERNHQPWIATVYFVADDENNLYWLSWPERRHSKELAENIRAAIAIPIQTEQPVIGIQAEGTVEVVRDVNIVEQIMPSYITKYGQGTEFAARFKAGTAKHALYKFTPEQFVLFDELHFPGDARQEISLH